METDEQKLAMSEQSSLTTDESIELGLSPLSRLPMVHSPRDIVLDVQDNAVLHRLPIADALTLAAAQQRISTNEDVIARLAAETIMQESERIQLNEEEILQQQQAVARNDLYSEAAAAESAMTTQQRTEEANRLTQMRQAVFQYQKDMQQIQAQNQRVQETINEQSVLIANLQNQQTKVHSFGAPASSSNRAMSVVVEPTHESTPTTRFGKGGHCENQGQTTPTKY